MTRQAVTVVLPGSERFGRGVASVLGGEPVAVDLHRFPDGEVRVRVEDARPGPAVIVCSLYRPDALLAPLLFLCDLLREQGSAPLLLLAPYLAYLRQDRAFHPGEAISARSFARLLDSYFGGIVTVDPHLHRIASLDALFARPARAVSAAPAIAAWVRQAVRDPLFVGPDEESRQWVQSVAAESGAPSVVMQKERRGDRDVRVHAPGMEAHAGRTPVIVDDIVSSGGTMIEAVRRVREAGLAPPLCVAVHGIFADDCLGQLEAAGAARVVSCNTIAHPCNAIDVAPAAARAARELLEAMP